MIDSLMFITYLFNHPFGSHHPGAAFSISSTAFKTNHRIPLGYTCKGSELFIPVSWRNVPKKAKSLALLVFDEDAPHKTRYHFAAYNIKPTKNGLKSLHSAKIAFQTAKNSWGAKAYKPPCFAPDEHHYIIRLYALDKKLLPETIQSALNMREAMRHHIIRKVQITGVLYAKESPKTFP
jgi:Raf kinase inhibitor-like YbhB/YbcL family protein